MTDYQFSYNDYEYRTYLDIEDDNQKLFHLCYKNGQEIRMTGDFYNCSPYRLITIDEFKKFVHNVEIFIQG